MSKDSKILVLFANPISFIGAIIAATGFLVGVVLLTLELLHTFSNAYIGLVVYMMIPAVIAGGLCLACLGAIISMIKRKKTGHVAPFPVLDLNEPRVRRRLFVVCVLGFIFLAVSSVAGYKAYHYTESVEFCGEVCHEVMKPEYVAYQHSPHAHITCAECHIGEGAAWFVKAKLSGLHQVYAVMKGDFHRPIQVPIHNLRPAKQTCSECHWPKKFYGAVMKSWTYYLPDEKNSPWTIRMLMKVGAGDPAHGPVEGIHSHMSEDNIIEYVSVDDKRLVIPWIKVTDGEGNVTIYKSENDDEKISEEEIAKLDVRRMDCVDCHNRPTHHYRTPNKALDMALSVKKIDPAIPGIKAFAAELLAGEYETELGAHEKMSKALREEYPDLKGIDDLVIEVNSIYSHNMFPEMKVSWREYPDHIGHKVTPGCFRCHDGNHVSDTGKTLSKDCNSCHTILAQGPGEEKDLQEFNSKGLEFKHPEDIDGEWKETRCNECHEGTPM